MVSRTRPGRAPIPNSTALVLQALFATGQNPEAARWAPGGNTPLAELIATQDAGGGYTFPGNSGPDAFTTAQVPPALEMAPYPVSVAYTKGFTPASEAKAATASLLYLQTQQSASNGSIPLGSSTDSVSEEYAIGAAAAGYDPKALRNGGGPSVMTYLSTQAASACATAGGCGLLIQAVVAAHLNPSSFGGVNLLTTLKGMYKAGVYGDGEAFTESLAIQGLVAAGQTVPAAAIHHLVAAQDSDGGWDYLLIKDDPNGSTDYDTSDTNSTAMVLMALNAAGTSSRNASALAWLHTQQDGDGGFPYQAGAGSDPDSTALVLQALFATGQNPEAARWAPGGNTPLAELIATQDAGGGYTFPGNSGPDAFTTAQVPPALSRAPYPLDCGSTACYTTGTKLSGVRVSPVAPPRLAAGSAERRAPSPGVTRRLLRVALAVPLLAIGLGTASAAARVGPAEPLCVQAASAYHAGIVVELGNGQVVRQCVGFNTSTITALSVLQGSGIEYATASYGGLGEAVCQIDDEPASYTACLPSSGSYWVFFVSRGGGAWTSSPQGVSVETVGDGDDVGFRYDPLAGADPPPVSPAGTCATSTPTPSRTDCGAVADANPETDACWNGSAGRNP